MSVTGADVVAGGEPAATTPARSLRSRGWHRFLQDRAAVSGAVVLGLLFVAA